MAQRSRYNFAMNAHAPDVMPETKIFELKTDKKDDDDIDGHFVVSGEPQVESGKQDYLDKVFTKIEVIKDPKLSDNVIGNHITAALPVAVSNIIMMAWFHQMPILGSDHECSCGQCTKCEATVHMLDHSLDVAAYRMRAWLTSHGFNNKTKESLQSFAIQHKHVMAATRH